MNKSFILILLTALLFAACSPDAKQKSAEINKLETELKESSTKGVADTTKVKQLLADYGAYAKMFPTDSMTPPYLMKSAKFYEYVGLTDSAIYCYNIVYSTFPTYPKANLALFSEAFLYANTKNNLVKAGELYREYLAKYPTTKLAQSATMELHNLGKTPDQIMAEMDSMNRMKKDSTQ